MNCARSKVPLRGNRIMHTVTHALTAARYKRAAAVLAAVGVAACGTEATDPLRDPGALAAQFDMIGDALDTPPLQSLGALALAMYLAGVEVHSISPTDLGTTLEWDTSQQGFVLSGRTDGPPDGMRVLLYAIDDVTGLPSLPLVEVGVLDLYAENSVLGGPPDSASLRFVVRDTGSEPITYADFTAESVYNPSCLCASVAGYVTDGTTRVEFSVPYDIIFQGAIHFGGLSNPPATFQTDPAGFSFVNDVTLVEDRADVLDFAYELHVNARFAFMGDSAQALGSLRVDDAGASSVTLTVHGNGTELGTVNANGSVTYQGANDRDLSIQEQDVLRALVRALFAIGLYIEYPTLVIFYCGC